MISGGIGGMGAQPLAVTMCDGVFLGADVDPARIEKRIQTKYCDLLERNLDKAIDRALDAKKKGRRSRSGWSPTFSISTRASSSAT